MSNKTNNLYEFGEFCLHVRDGILYRDDRAVSLAPKVFDTLRVLVESEGKILSKEELMNAVWQDSFVEESNLTQNIYTLRQTFGKRNKFIETVPRRGYRFSEPVKIKPELPENGNGHESNGDRSIDAARSSDLENPPIAASGPRIYGSRRFNYGVLFGVIATLLISAIVFFVWNRGSSPEAIGVQKVDLSNLTDTGDVRHISISPDGQFLAFVKNDANNGKRIWIKDIVSKEELPINLSDEFQPQYLNFSPDGNWIYFVSGRTSQTGAGIYKTSRFGGSAEFIVGNVWSDFDISPNGDSIAFYRDLPDLNAHELVVADLQKRSERVIVKKQFPNGFELRGAPAISADMNSVFAIAKPQESPISELVKIDIESGDESVIELPALRQVVSVSAMPFGDDLIISAREPSRFPQVYKLQENGRKLTRLTNDLNAYRKIATSADGGMIVALQKINSSHLWILPDSNAAYARQLTFGKDARDGKHGIDVLPDGKIVYTSLADMNRDLWLIDPGDGAKLQLTKQRSDINERPLTSADGKFIYFSSLQDMRHVVERISPDGQSIEKLAFDGKANCQFPNISPDGATLYYLKKARGNSIIFKRDLNKGVESEMALPQDFFPDGFLALSPDGRFLAFRQVSQAKGEELEEENSRLVSIGIVPTDGDFSKARALQINTSQSQFRWSSDSEAIFFIENAGISSSIVKQPVFSEGDPEKMLELNGTTIYHFQFTENKDLVLSQGKHLDDAVLITNFQ